LKSITSSDNYGLVYADLAKRFQAGWLNRWPSVQTPLQENLPLYLHARRRRGSRRDEEGTRRVRRQAGSKRETALTVKPGWEGRYFEDFDVGDIYRCRLGRTVTEADNIWFTLLTNNTNQIHFNNEYGKRTEFGKCLINSALTLAIVAGMGVADVSENGFALGWDEIKLPNPLFAGDTLYSESEVLEKRESKSKPQWGIIKVRTRGIQQEGKVVIDYARSVMVWKKAHAPKSDLFPEIREERK